MLRDLETRSDLNGKTLFDLQEDPDQETSLAAFDNQTIRTVVVRNWPDEDFLYLVFLRLNTGSVPLSPQELRQALHPGPFIDFAEEFSANSQAIRKALNLRDPDFRMRDVELLVRYFAFATSCRDTPGTSKRFLDFTCESLNAAWATDEKRIWSQGHDCEDAIEATVDIFGRHAFRRWSGEAYEGRFNRAVFDIMAFYFRLEEAREAALERRDVVVEAFQLVSADEAFQDSVQTTTKSIEATHLRLAAWGRALAEVLEIPLPIPVLAANRIQLPD